jgi:hypothetical protein
MRPGTLDAYVAMMGKWIEPFFKDLALKEITSAHVSRFLGKLDESGLASNWSAEKTVRLSSRCPRLHSRLQSSTALQDDKP